MLLKAASCYFVQSYGDLDTVQVLSSSVEQLSSENKLFCHIKIECMCMSGPAASSLPLFQISTRGIPAVLSMGHPRARPERVTGPDSVGQPSRRRGSERDSGTVC